MSPEESLWRFSLAVYGRPGVDAACIDLQDRLGADVNLLLLALWAGAVCGTPLSAADLERLASEAAAWHRPVVAPLRGVRRHLKGIEGAEALRQAVKAAELESERLEQMRLCRASGLRPGAPDWGAAEANLRRLVPGEPAVALLLAAARDHEGE
ncbi:TIGR02444 family protein [Azospirillum sp.]|uniref:TIGR02444 family protein n=1 Tax=Azospirillum sp. TaxID=34012 RepID=UPI003D7263FD